VLAKLLRRVTGPSRLNCVGVREPGIVAMISVPCHSVLPCVEITRIECEERVRGTGICLRFVEKLAVASTSLGRCLVMGCVESERMLTLMRRHDDAWQRLESDPTSFVFLPSAKSITWPSFDAPR
jgi:hypothetical protein